MTNELLFCKIGLNFGGCIMKQDNDLLKMMKEISKELPFLKEMLQNDIRILRSDEPGAEIAAQLQAVINGNPGEVYFDKPYLVTTENQRFIGKILPTDVNHVASILGSVDNVFECVAEGVGTIHVWDVNRLQNAVYHLKRASILTLSPKEYDQFLVDYTSKRYLSNDVFKTVKQAIADECYQNAWDVIFGMNPQEDLKNYLFKGPGIDLSKLRYGLPYLKNKSRYYTVRENLPKTDIAISNEDIISGILSSSETFDFIDFSNTLLFIYQLDCNSNVEEFHSKIKQVKDIYDNHLNPGGVMMLDYWFGARPEKLSSYVSTNPEEEKTLEIYQHTYDLLYRHFDLETCSVEPILNGLFTQKFDFATGKVKPFTLNPIDNRDTVIYTKKRK